MAGLARQAVEAGAIGFSTSRTRNHRSSNGELTPTLTADADELLGIARAIGATGTGVLQAVSDFDDVDAEFALVPVDGRGVGSAAVLLARRRRASESWRRQLELLDAGQRRRGAHARPGRRPRHRHPARPPVHAQPAARQPGVAGDRRPAGRGAGAGACPIRPSRQRVLDAAGAGRGALGGFDRMFELGDPPDYEPDAVHQRRGPCRAGGPRRPRARLRPAAPGRGPHVPVRADHQLVRRQPRCGGRDARPRAHRPGPVGRRRPRRHDLRRQLPHHVPLLLGPRPRRRSHGPRLPRAPAHQGHGRDGRAARPWRAGAGLPRRRQPHRLRRAASPVARRCATTCPPAASGSSSGPTATSPPSSRGRSPTRPASPPTPSRVG